MKKHYEWVVCFCCFLVFFVNIGLPSTAFNVFQPYITALPTIGNTGGSIILAARTLVSLVCMFFVEKYVARFGARKGATLAMFMTALGFLFYSLADDFPLFFLGALFAGAGLGFGGMVIITLVTRKWFITGMATALGIATTGSGFASVFLSPTVARIIETYGLGWGFRLEAGVALIFGCIVFALLRDKPEQLGLRPHLSENTRISSSQAKHESLEHELPPSVRILLIVGVACLSSAAINGVSYFSILLTSQGIDTLFAATVIAVLGLSQTIGKFISGMVIDRIGTLAGTFILYGLLIGGILGCIFSGVGGPVVCIAAAVLFGLGMTLGSLGTSLWSMELSTKETMAKSVKNLQIAYSLGGFVFNLVPGPVADLTGSYVVSYVILLVMALISIFITQGIYIKYRMCA